MLAVSGGMLATGGLPTQALGANAASAPVTSSQTSTPTMYSVASTGLLAALPGRSSGTPLTAPMTATVTFESSAFEAEPVVRRAVARHAASAKGTPSAARTAASHAAAAVKTASSRHAAAPAKAAPAKAAPAKAAAKPAPVKAAPVKAAPARKATPRHPITAAPPKRAPKADPPAKRNRHVAPPKTSKPVVAKPKKPRVTKPKPAPHKTTPAGSVRGSSVLAIAARYVGTPYLYGGSTPRGFDCSGYTSYVYRQLGIHIPRTANQQMHATKRVSRSQARAGDLVFFVSGGRAYHVGIYAGGGKMYDSPHTGARISKRSIWDSSAVFGRVTR